MVMKKIDNSQQNPPGLNEALSDILYVEDEDTNWYVTELHLKNEFNLMRARDSNETFERLKNETIDLILLDIQLGGSEFDGIEICKILKKDPSQNIPLAAQNLECKDIPVVFVTAYASRYSREMLLKVGAQDVITKPVDFHRLQILSNSLIHSQDDTPALPGTAE